MGVYVNRDFTIEVGQNLVIPLNRWGEDDYTVQVKTGGTLNVEGTLDRINRGETATYATLSDKEGTALSALAVGIAVINETPLEAIRLTAAAATVTGRLMQQGKG